MPSRATRDVRSDGRCWPGLQTVIDECSLDARSVDGGDVVSQVGETGGEGGADVAASDDARYHGVPFRLGVFRLWV